MLWGYIATSHFDTHMQLNADEIILKETSGVYGDIVFKPEAGEKRFALTYVWTRP